MCENRITGLDAHSGRGLSVLVENGRIVRVDEAPGEHDTYLAPGLVDLQVNGYAGYDLNGEELTTETVARLTDAMLSRGVTCFLPTLITSPREDLTVRLRTVAEARQKYPRVAACVPFVHLEGPNISPLDGYRGAHPAEFVRPPSLAEFERCQSESGGLVGMVTLSPHFAESPAYIAALVSRGVVVSLGHTDASFEQIAAAVDAGAKLSTHLGNGIAQHIHRHRNPIWSQLGDERLTAMFIADGHHLPAQMLKAMLRAKGIGNSILVSDTVSLAGSPVGIYNSAVGGKVELKPDGRLCVAGTEFLAGSTTPLARCIGLVMQMTGISLAEALSMATTNPGRFAGRPGLLRAGERADLLRFRWDGELHPEEVWLGGERVNAQTA